MTGTRISDMTHLGSLPTSGGRVPIIKDGDSANYNYDLAADLAARPTSAALSANTGTSLLGYLPAPTGISAMNLQTALRLGLPIKPQHFGAVCDGVTDDLAALQAMNDWYFNNGSVIYPYTLDMTANCAGAGQFNFGPSAASVLSQRWAVQGQFTFKQLQAGVTQSIKVRNLNYGVYPIRFEPIGYGSNLSTFSNRDTLFGVTFENCGYAQFFEVYGHGHYFAAVNIIGNSPLFAEGLRIHNVISQYCGSGYVGSAGFSLTSTWTAGAQTGTAGSTAQSQLVNCPTLPKAAFDTLGPVGTFPGAVRLRIGSDPDLYLVTGINRATNDVTIYPWLRPAAGSSGTLTWCFGGAYFIQGSDTEGAKVDKLYGILSGAGMVAASAYEPVVGESDVENCGTGSVFGSRPDSVSYGGRIGHAYCEANSEDIVTIGHWGTFQHFHIPDSYTIDPNKIRQIGDPTNADGSFGFAGGTLGVYGPSAGYARITIQGKEHRFFGPANGATNAWTTTATFYDHAERQTIRPQNVDSQTVTLGDVDVNLHRLFGYKGGSLWFFTGSGPSGEPTGTLAWTPLSRAYASCVTTSGSTTVTMPSTAGLFAGMPITGTGIAGSTTIASVTNSTAIVLSAAATASGTVSLTFTGSINGAFTTQSWSKFVGAVGFLPYFKDAYGLQWIIRPVCGWHLNASATVDPASIATGASSIVATITVTGAALGDRFVASFGVDLQGLIPTAYVSAANTVKVVLANLTGGAVDLASSTVTVSKVA